MFKLMLKVSLMAEQLVRTFRLLLLLAVLLIK